MGIRLVTARGPICTEAQAIEEAQTCPFEPEGGQWWAGTNDEWFTIGPLPSREGVIAEARHQLPGESFHICRAALQQVSFSAERMIEDQYFEQEDLFSYEDGNDPDRVGDHAAADAELQAFLDDWTERYRHTFVRPTLFAWVADRDRITPLPLESECPLCHGLNLWCPDGCGRNANGELEEAFLTLEAANHLRARSKNDGQ